MRGGEAIVGHNPGTSGVEEQVNGHAEEDCSQNSPTDQIPATFHSIRIGRNVKFYSRLFEIIRGVAVADVSARPPYRIADTKTDDVPVSGRVGDPSLPEFVL